MSFVLILINVFITAAFPIFAASYHGTNVSLALFIGCLIAAICILPLHLIFNGRTNFWRVLKIAGPIKMFVISICSVGIPFAFDLSLNFLDASQATSLLQFYPIIAAILLAPIFAGERPQLNYISIFFAMLASLLIIYDINGFDFSISTLGFFTGLLLASVSALSIGSGIISKKHQFELEDIISLSLILSLYRLILSILALFIFDYETDNLLHTFEYGLFLGLFAHFLGNATCIFGLHYAKNDNIVLLFLLEIPLALLILSVFNGDNISMAIWVSAALVIFGQLIKK